MKGTVRLFHFLVIAIKFLTYDAVFRVDDSSSITRGTTYEDKTPRRVSLWNGRLIVSRSLENRRRKNKNSCSNSYGKRGTCTRLAMCETYNMADLFNNVCFMDVFVPGICCLDRDIRVDTTTRRKETKRTTSTPTTTTETPDSASNKTKKASTDYWNHPGCGVQHMPSSRIVQGDRSVTGEWPWMAAIFITGYTGRKFHCGGSLISKRHILTGAHCLKTPLGRDLIPAQLVVRLGDTDISTLRDGKDSHAKFYRVRKAVPHKNFRNINSYFLNDVAVITLKDDVTFSDSVFPICLPSEAMKEEPLDSMAGDYGTVIGYGKTEMGVRSQQLLEGRVPIWKNGECDDAYFSPIIDIFICAGFKDGGVDACQGDSGGPLQVKLSKEWVQVGITSFGRGCGEASYPGVYTRVSKYIEWIRKEMKR